MRFHVISLPHTQTTKDYVICAFTEKIRRFCIMMKGLGHTVYLYASEENEAPCDELITCITIEQQQEALAGKHFVEAEFNNELPHWKIFNGNVIKELGNHAEFLNIMSRNEMLAMYFVHDGGETSKWRLKGHAVSTFYSFVSSWAIMLSNPSNIGFPMDGYDLPSLNIQEKQIKTETRDNGLLFNDTAISAIDFNQELRLTKLERIDEVVKLVNNSNENFIIWIKQNEEGELLRKLIPDAIEVKGSDSPEYKE